MMDNAGREKLLNSLEEENNSTLLELDTNSFNWSYSPNDIQSKIDTEMKWNLIWKRYNTNYGLPTAIVLSEKKKKTTVSHEIESLRKKKKKKKEEHGKKIISLVIYPVLLEVLQNRPTHLYQFLRNENYRLCEYDSNEEHDLRTYTNFFKTKTK